MKVVHGQDQARCAILQPTTSLVSTLTFVKPCYEHTLDMLCVGLPLPVPTLPLLHSSSPRHHHVSELERFQCVRSNAVPSITDPTPVSSCLLSAVLQLSKQLTHFSWSSLLPWYPYTQDSVFKTSAVCLDFERCVGGVLGDIT